MDQYHDPRRSRKFADGDVRKREVENNGTLDAFVRDSALLAETPHCGVRNSKQSTDQPASGIHEQMRESNEEDADGSRKVHLPVLEIQPHLSVNTIQQATSGEASREA